MSKGVLKIVEDDKKVGPPLDKTALGDLKFYKSNSNQKNYIKECNSAAGTTHNSKGLFKSNLSN
jgi:hypothetical protein